ncbi:hypothetical protein Hanom_Chr13g01236811 [Helianthus anomalus]
MHNSSKIYDSERTWNRIMMVYLFKCFHNYETNWSLSLGHFIEQLVGNFFTSTVRALLLARVEFVGCFVKILDVLDLQHHR